MSQFIVTLIVTAISMIVTAKVIPGIVINSVQASLIGAFVFGLVNAIVKPLLILFTLPATILSLGLFLFVVNALCFWLVAYFTPGFEVKGFFDALFGSVLLSLVAGFLNQFFDKSA
ncbi:phage holin family protein [Geminocystis sp. NIES-3709]|uniref:phage holin family protein n=1 Tax=Geminocystis sp. NIES-3709 TaxID=1617448 RepID=UPI0005FC9220|nr:phage holin family protein [Geminocystis sp. NIES-3709]BAQ64983.1 putative membrane protein [Geminocystis sp. NIES-3709]